MGEQMPTIATRFGHLTYSPEACLEFPAGLPGFEQEHHFVLIDEPANRPLVFLQSVQTPDLCFTTVPVHLIDNGYQLHVTREDLERLGLPYDRQPDTASEVACLAIICAARGRSPTANLLGPVVINRQTRTAIQAIREDSRYSARHTLLEAAC
jgi:flagellar assembly factor FliW